jgi:hypothetical protein
MGMKEELQLKIKKLLQEFKKLHYTKPETISDAQAMGVLMSFYFDYDGLQILKAAYEGLEDSNFHTENIKIREMIKNIENL